MTPRSPVRRLPAAFALAALCAAIAASPALAALYKWTDANGRVVYSDQPPAGGVKYETVGGAPPPANAGATRDLAQQEADLKKRQAEKAEESAKVQKARAEASKRMDVCTQARGRVRQLAYSDQVVLYRFNEKGEQVAMTPDERRRELEEQQKLEREYCKPG